MKLSRSFLLLMVFLSCRLQAGDGPTPQQRAFFETKIRPVLVKQCYECHSSNAMKAGKLKGGLALDTRESVLRGGDSGPALVPGKPAESLLLSALKYEGYEMPPKGQLPEGVIANFEKWIADGAADPRDGKALETQSQIDFEKARQFWSLQPISQPAVPPVEAVAWPKSKIDRFVLAKLEQKNLQPLGDADLRVLVRRLYFDLIGLPPTPAQMDRFLKTAQKNRDGTIAGLVEELLASPHFGERWGRHWLDVVRYAESNGRDVNVVWYDAWRYRNWVIQAFNQDMPFSRFIREQVAGDLLPAKSFSERDRQQIATGFLAMSPKMIGEQNKAQFRMDLIDEQIEVVSRAFLGLSVSCARCHDHKFDPIPTADYYALAGIFKSTQPLYGFGRVGVKNSPHTELIPIGRHSDELGKSGLEYRQQVVDRHLEFQQARSARYGVVRRVADAKNKLKKPDADKEQLQSDIETMEAQVAEWDQKIKALEEKLKEFTGNPPPQPEWAMGVRDSEKPVNCRIHIRGETGNLSDSVPRGVLRAIEIQALPSISDQTSGRLQLAEWLSHDKNPLTPRVAVNRVWKQLFGRGLVATVDDFGKTGSPPSHPGLLDHLADQFRDEGWSVKQLIRRIVLSRTYQLASSEASGQDNPDSALHQGMAKDPDNIFLWRFRPRRLEAEIFRDAILAVSGKLEDSPPTGPFLGKWNRYEHDKIANSKPFITPEGIEDSHRSLYLPVLRGSLPEVFELFDFADPNRVVGQREESTVPSQALFLMNSPWMRERAEWTADRMLQGSSLDEAARVEALYSLAFSRLPNSDELQDALAYLRQTVEEKDQATENRRERWTRFCQIVLGSAEFRYIQ